MNTILLNSFSLASLKMKTYLSELSQILIDGVVDSDVVKMFEKIKKDEVVVGS